MKRTRRHALGQHFLTNRSVLGKIIRIIAPEEGDIIIEIGAGKGALTFALTEKAKQVIALEKDPALVSRFEGQKSPRLTVLQADALAVDFSDILKKADPNAAGRAKLVGNLPYSISSPFLFKALAARALFSKCVFLIQKEVAERICGRPGSKNYAPLSVLIQNEFEAKIEFTVAPGSFSPPPRVDSALISLIRRKEPLYDIGNLTIFRDFLWSAFAHRRKFLAKNLEMSRFQRSRIEEAFCVLDLPKNARAEQLSISQFAALFHLLQEKPRPMKS